MMHPKITSKYTIDFKIGNGGMADVYRVTEKSTLRKYALKVIHPEKANSYVAMKRFKEEINNTKNVNSNYVVKIFDYRWDEDVQYILMEYIEGMDLKEYIKSKGRLTVEEAVEFAKQISLGFEEIHAQGIKHRDIKSGNIMVTAHNQIKIIDFGIAINDETERLTSTDTVVASPFYLAPELIEQEKATRQSDIYALGILLFEMLTGDVPFRDLDQIRILRMHQSDEVPHVNKIFSNIPQALANVVIKATAKSKDIRYKTMYEFYKDISTSLDSSRAFDPVFQTTKKVNKSFIQRMNSKWVGIFIIALITILLVVVIAILSVKVLA